MILHVQFQLYQQVRQHLSLAARPPAFAGICSGAALLFQGSPRIVSSSPEVF